MAHPYYPLDAHILNYKENKDPIVFLILQLSLGLGVVLGLAYFIAHRICPSISNLEAFAVLWFTLSGTLHCFFEGYFVTHYKSLGPAQDVFAQLWKEYALSDSRYLSSDTFVLCIETITVTVWGPLCLFLAYLIVYRHPLRDFLQTVVCIAHIYGDLLYYATSLLDHYARGIAYSRPEAVYFWLYYFFMNFIWIVVPAYLLYESSARTRLAFEALNEVQKRQKSS